MYLGLSLHFFIDVGVYNDKRRNERYENLYCSKRDQIYEESGSKWWLAGDPLQFYDSVGSEKSENEKPVRLWTAVTFCCLFRNPFLRQISDCIQAAYHNAILPSLEEWETKRFQSSRSGNPLDSAINQYQLHIEHFIAALALECPKPIAGFLSLTLQLPALNPLTFDLQEWNIYRSSFSSGCDSPLGRITVKFQQPSVEDLPRCSYPVQLLLKYFTPRNLVDMVCAILSECRLLFHSTELSRLPVICEGLRALVYPLKWTHGA